MKNPNNFLLKILFISHFYILIKYSVRESLLALAIGLIIALTPKTSSRLDHKIEQIFSLLGQFILKFILIIIYFLIIIPSRIFYKSTHKNKSSYIDVSKKIINYKTLW